MTTANLALPELAAAQAQKHVTVNEALRSLDALVQLAVLDRDLAAPPGTPAEGQRWLVAASPSGDWAGHADEIAVWQDDGWDFYTPQIGWLAYVADEGALLAWTGNGWVDAIAALTSLNNMTLLGVGTAADATNPFSARLNNILWVARALAEGGDGDLRWKMSKEGASNTLSMLFQTGFSGRAELGLTGDDDFHIKVSPNGSSWLDALSLDRATGGISFRAHSTDLASGATCDIGAAASLRVRITGTTAIASFGSEPKMLRLIEFAGALTLTHNATSLILPGGADIPAAAGDTAIAASDAAGNWRIAHYQRAAVAPPRSGTFTPAVSLVGGAGNTVPVYSTNIGRYTRVGNRVWVDIHLSGDGGAEGAGSGVINIALPFVTSASFPLDTFPAGIMRNGTSEYQIYCEIQSAPSTTVRLNYIDAISNMLVTQGALQNNAIRFIRLQFSYEV
jgi:hypothetical protein